MFDLPLCLSDPFEETHSGDPTVLKCLFLTGDVISRSELSNKVFVLNVQVYDNYYD